MVILILISLSSSLTPFTEGAFTSKKYRNLFAELDYSQSDIDAKLNKIYTQLFEGSDKVYFDVGDGTAYVSDIKNNDVRTEGISYGLMVAVQLNKRDIFDKIWRWGSKHMQHHSGSYEGYFAWSCSTSGNHNSEGAASDGELYFVTALIFASNRWGNDGEINYLSEAHYIIDNAFKKSGTPGNFINTQQHLITFTPDDTGWTDPSYNIPAFYDVWNKWGNDGHESEWSQCASKARQYLHSATHSTTGLSPDYSNFDGSPHASGWGVIGEAFRFDAWRVPMNIALDFSWSHADASWQTEYGERIQNFFYSKGIDKYDDQYNVDGSTVSQIESAGGKTALRHSLGLVATLGAVSLTVTHDKGKEFVDAFWKAEHVTYSDGYFDAYFDGFLQLFAFLHLSGNYQVIFPQ